MSGSVNGSNFGHYDFHSFFVENGIEDLEPLFLQNGISTLDILKHVDVGVELSNIVPNTSDCTRCRYALLRLQQTDNSAQPSTSSAWPNPAINYAQPAYPQPAGYQQAQYAQPVQYAPGPAYAPVYQPPAPAPVIVNIENNQQQHRDERAPLLHTHSTVIVRELTPENNCCLGFWMGFFFGIWGLCCLFCVRNKRSYMRGWAIPFVLTLVAGAVICGVYWRLVIDTYDEILDQNQHSSSTSTSTGGGY